MTDASQNDIRCFEGQGERDRPKMGRTRKLCRLPTVWLRRVADFGASAIVDAVGLHKALLLVISKVTGSGEIAAPVRSYGDAVRLCA
jgi:hypothetical protein